MALRLLIEHEANKDSDPWEMGHVEAIPIIVPAFCLEKDSKPQCWEGKTKRLNFPELRRPRWEFKEATWLGFTAQSLEVGCKKRVLQRSLEGPPPVCIWVLNYNMYESQLLETRGRTTQGQIIPVPKRQSRNFITHEASIRTTIGILFFKGPGLLGHMVFGISTPLCHCSSKISRKQINK